MHRSQPGSEHRETIAQIPLRSGSIPSWVHDFPYTQNYMILPETPVYFDLKVRSSAHASRVEANRGNLIMLVAPSACVTIYEAGAAWQPTQRDISDHAGAGKRQARGLRHHQLEAGRGVAAACCAAGRQGASPLLQGSEILHISLHECLRVG